MPGLFSMPGKLCATQIHINSKPAVRQLLSKRGLDPPSWACKPIYRCVPLLAIFGTVSDHHQAQSTTSRSSKMFWTTLLGLAALAEAAPSSNIENRQFGSTTMLRFGCPNVVIDRLDPLVNPGAVPSSHVHQIVGGNAFNASMTTGDVAAAASCTTCQFSKFIPVPVSTCFWIGLRYRLGVSHDLR